jgi:hypothetical protein
VAQVADLLGVKLKEVLLHDLKAVRNAATLVVAKAFLARLKAKEDKDHFLVG